MILMIILKIGGSILTYKDSKTSEVDAASLKRIASEISQRKLINVTVGVDQRSTKKVIQAALNQSALKIHNISLGPNVATKLQGELNKIGLHIDIDAIQSQEDFEKLPFTWKGDLREAYPLGLQAVPDEEIVRIIVVDDYNGLCIFIESSVTDNIVI